MGMKFRWMLVVLAMAPLFVLNSCSGSNNAPADTSFMWVATQGDQKVRSYTIRQNNGAINTNGSNGSPAATGVQPEAILIKPDRKIMYMENADETITAY